MRKTLVRFSMVVGGVWLAACARPASPTRDQVVRSLVGVPARTAGVVARMSRADVHVHKGEIVAELERARAELHIAEAKRDVEAGRSAHDSARAASAQTELQQAELEYQHTFVRAPVDGVIVGRATKVGDPVGVGSVVVAIAPDDPPAR